MKTKFIIIFICLLGQIIFLQAQINLQWQKNIGGSGTDVAYSIKPTNDGGYIVAGQSNSPDGDVTGNHGAADYWVAKLDAARNITWQKSYGGSGNDIARCIQPTLDGGYIIAGYSDSHDGDITDHGQFYHVDGNGNINYLGYAGIESWVVKIDNTGTVSWAKTLHNIFIAHNSVSYFPNFINTIIQAPNGEYIFGGNGWMFLTDSEFFNGAMIGKLNSSGGFTDMNIFFEAGVITAVTNTAAGYTVTGFGTGYFNKGGTDVFISAFASDGSNLWEYSYGGSNDDKANSIQLTNDNGYILAGSTASSDIDFAGSGNHGADDCLLMKLNSAGELQWSKCFGGSATDIGNAVQQTADGGYFIGASSLSADGQVTDHSTGAAQADCWFLKTTSTGNFSWAKSYGGTAADDAYALEKTTDGGYIAAGASASTDAGFANKGNSDYWVLKFKLGCGSIPLPVACNQNFCSAANPIVANLLATGTNLKWYRSLTDGCALNSLQPLATGSYFVSQTVSPGCESPRKGIYVTVNHSPNMPPAPATQHFCSQHNPRVSDLRAWGTSLKWYSTATGGTLLSPSVLLATGYYFVSQTSQQGCESSRKKVSVIVRHCCNSAQQRLASDAGTIDITGGAMLYPNPAKNIVTIRISTENNIDKVFIKIIDINGKVFLQDVITNSKGIAQKTIDISRLANGLYAVLYISGTETGTVKLQVQK
jgi:hypothetical protein